MPFIYAPAGSSPRLGDDNLNVRMGNSLNSSRSGGERRSGAPAQFIELSITTGRGHRSGSGEAAGSPGCASQNCTTLLQHQFHRACGLAMLERGYRRGCCPSGDGDGSWCSIWDQTIRVWANKSTALYFWKPDLAPAVFWVSLSEVGPSGPASSG